MLANHSRFVRILTNWWDARHLGSVSAALALVDVLAEALGACIDHLTTVLKKGFV